MEKMLEFFEWFRLLFTDFNGWLKTTVNFDGRVLDLYTTYVEPLDEWIKILGAIGVAILIIGGLIGAIKKAYKLILIILLVLINLMIGTEIDVTKKQPIIKAIKPMLCGTKAIKEFGATGAEYPANK